jgi:hypothetical protein
MVVFLVAIGLWFALTGFVERRDRMPTRVLKVSEFADDSSIWS